MSKPKYVIELSKRDFYITCFLCIVFGAAFMLLILSSKLLPEETDVETAHTDIYDDEIVVEFYDIPLDDVIQEHVMTLCKWYGVDEKIVFAMIERESGFDISAAGDSGDALGLMQIQSKWHEERMLRLNCNDLLNPFENVVVGIDYFAELMRMERGVEWALMAYNGGFAYASEMVENGEVSDYASSVLYRAGQMEYRDEGGEV